MTLDELCIYMFKAMVHWSLTFHNNLMYLLWKQIISQHAILQTQHSYADNQKANSDWQGSLHHQMAIYGEESERQSWEDEEYWQWNMKHLYNTVCHLWSTHES